MRLRILGIVATLIFPVLASAQGGLTGKNEHYLPGNPRPLLTSSISHVDFGEIDQGDVSRRRFVITNSGRDDVDTIRVYSAWLSENDARVFASDFAGPVDLAPGESYAIEVSYAPQEGGETTGALYLSHNGRSSLEIFSLTGVSTGQVPFQRRAVPAGNNNLGFGKSVLAGVGNIKPTTLQFGPDGRLYAADMLGAIKIYDVERQGSNDYQVTGTETINLIKDIQNHNDNGVANNSVNNRLVTGLTVVGTASQPIIYVASSDPRIGGGPSHTDTNLDTNSGILSRLTKQGNQWVKLDLVRGLPRSEENHHQNGMVLDTVTNHLYLTSGGNTNAGATSNNFALLPEYALSAAILEIDLGQIGNTTYDLPTLDDESRTNSGQGDVNDPFGGNNGKNQAKLVPGGPVQVYSPGFRNPYDIVLTEDRRLYTFDNGPNAGWGGAPVNSGPQGVCSNALNEPGQTFFDALHYITGRGYYGGHANPTRGNTQNTFNSSNPQSPVTTANPIECDYRGAGPANGALTLLGTSTNGLAEYTASNFNNAMRGDLLAVGFDNKLYRMQLNSNGTAVTSKTALFSNVGSIPLDVVAQGDNEVFAGTIWVADFVKKEIVVFEPSDYSGQVADVCGNGPGSADEDGDGFTNADEISNGTNACSAADFPGDLDDDGISDLNDPDDDNDGQLDLVDPFPLDAQNGRATDIPLSYTWENNGNNPGYLFNLGFSGLMSNGVTDYRNLYDASQITAGGAAGVFTIDNIPGTDPVAAVNTQEYAFQFGVDVTPQTPVFTARTRVLAPFAGVSPAPHQSMGLQIGKGDQDNYIKLVVNASSVTGGLQFAAEENGQFQSIKQFKAPVYGAEAVDLYLTVNPAMGQVTASYQITNNGQVGPVLAVDGTANLPSSWIDGTNGLAVGIISTSFGASPFSATWDFMEVQSGAPLVPVQDDDGGTGTDDGTSGDSSSDNDGSANADTGADTNTGTGTGSAGGSDTGTDSNGDGNTGTGTGTGTGGAGSSGSGVLVVNAEDFTARTATPSHQWVTDNRAGALGGAMITTPDAGVLKPGSSGSPMLSYSVDFPAAGPYHVWVRGWGDTDAQGEGRSDSVHVGLNGSLSSAAAMDQFPAGWHWSNSQRGVGTPTITVPSAGVHTVNLWMREDGLAVDQLILAQSASYVPQGAGATDSGNSSGNSGADADSGSGDANSGSDNTAGDNTGSQSDDGSAGSDNDSDNAQGNDSGSASSGGSTSTGDGILSLEAEDFVARTATASHQWVSGNRAGASAGASMITTPDVGMLKPNQNGTPMMSYSINVAEAGVYQVWVRAWGDSNSQGEGRSDSVHVGLNGNLSTAAAMDRFPSGWHWSNSKRGAGDATIVVPTAGQHTVNVWMREDGLEIDKVLLVRSTSYVPSGTGPSGNDTSTTTGQGQNNGTGSGSGGTSDTGGGTDADSPSDTGGQTSGGSGSGDDANTDDASNSSLVFQQSSGVVSIEIEHPASNVATSTHQWVVDDRAGASGNSAMVTTPDIGVLKPGSTGAAVMTYRVNFTQTGVHQVWLRGWGDTNTQGEGRSDSVHVGINGNLSSAAAMDQFPSGWHWSNSKRASGNATVTVPTVGEHDLQVWMREDGLALDKLVIVKGNYQPMGMGPSETRPGVVLNLPAANNEAPVVDAGNDRTAEPGTPITIVGSVSDDGLPSASMSSQWRMLSGPDGAVFDDLNALQTTVTFAQPGAYTLELLADDGELSGSDSMRVEVQTSSNPSSGTTGQVNGNTSWQLRQSADGSQPRARHEAGAVAFDGKLYLLGGRGQRPVSVYDPAQNTWIDRSVPPVELNHFQPVVFGDRIYAIGAMSCCYPIEESVPHVYSYTPATDQWNQEAIIPESRRRGSVGAVVHNNRIYLVGGNTRGHSGGMVPWFDEFDPVSGEWRTLPSAPTPRDHMQVAVSAGRLVVAGGRQTAHPRVFNDVLGVVDVFDFDSGQWTRGNNIPSARAGTMAVSVGDEVIVIGGETLGFSQARDNVEAYNVLTGQWRTLQSLNQGRHGGGAAVIGNHIHVASGNATIGGGNETTSHETLQIDP